MSKATGVEIVTFDENHDAVDCATLWFANADAGAIGEFVSLNVDEDEYQHIRLLDREYNVIEETSIDDEDHAEKQIKKWKRAARKEQ